MRKIALALSIAALVLIGCETAGSAPAAMTEIVKVLPTGKPAAEGFDLTMQWMNRYFVSAKNVIQYSDKAAGMVTGKASTVVNKTPFGEAEVIYTLSIEVKDNKARLTFNAVELISQVYGSKYAPSKMAVNQASFDLFTMNAEMLADDYVEFVQTHTASW